MLKLEWVMIYFIFLASLALVTCYLAFHYWWHRSWKEWRENRGCQSYLRPCRRQMCIGLQTATSCILWQQDNHTLCFFYHSSPIWQLIAKWKVLHPIGVSSSHQWCLPTAQYVLSNTTSILKFLYANLYQDVKEWILISNFQIV